MTGKKTLYTIGTVLLACSMASVAHAEVAPAPNRLDTVFGFPVTNSMITSWIVSVLLVILIRLAVRRPKLVPTRAQALVEGLILGVRDMVEPIVGRRAIGGAFPLLVVLFIYILIQYWSGMVPGVGTVGWGQQTPNGFDVLTPLIRPGNADVNSTMALTLVSFIIGAYLVLRHAGIKAVIYDVFGNKADRADFPKTGYSVLSIIFFAIGFLEIISILARFISLPFRLFGNEIGGENLLHAMSGIMKWGLPIPFYFLETLIGVVQALVFTLLVSVYIGVICNHGDDHADDAAH